MKNKIIAIILSIIIITSALPVWSFASISDDIVILYENDVHCAVEGYTKLSAMKKELQKSHEYVGVVSGGDYIQGNSLGVISQGEYIVKLMNLVGYDAVALGNHEFDYRLERLEESVTFGVYTVEACHHKSFIIPWTYLARKHIFSKEYVERNGSRRKRL